MIKALLMGYGAMGKVVESIVSSRDDMEITAKCDLFAPDCYRAIADVREQFDVIIDFSKPESLEQITKYCSEHGTPVVLATTGYTIEQATKARELGKYAPVFYTQNMSLGINILEKVLREITPMLKDSFDIEIVESHHNKKVDAPSGTAKMLYNALNTSGDLNAVYGRDGYAPRTKNEVGIHAVRGGTIAGEHTVIFAGNDEIIEIKHTALSKKIFAEGAVRAAIYVANAKKGLYQMSDIL